MKDLFSIIEKSMENCSRDYGDVRISSFECGCQILAAQGEPRYTVFRQICEDHRIECEKLVGKEAVDKLILRDP